MTLSKSLARVEIERIRLKYEQAQLIVEKGLYLYLLFILVAIGGLIMKVINPKLLMLMLVFAFALLMISAIPLIIIMFKEREQFAKYDDEIKGI